MLCKNCGTELNENAKFCNSCGAAAEKESVPDIHSVSPENDSGNQQGQYSFSGEPAAADEAAQPGEAAPAETIDAVEAAPAEAAPAAKKHTLRNVLIAVAVIVVAVLIFGNKGKSESDSSTSLSAEESMVVGTWHLSSIYSDSNTSYYPKNFGTLYLYNDHTGSIYANGELFDSFTWYYGKYRNGYYFYKIYLSNGGIWAGIYDFEYFSVSGGDSLITFER